MNAIDLLEKQHAETLALLNALEKSKPGNTRKTSFKKLQSSLWAHMVIEEELFYPAVADSQRDGEPIAEGYEEHAGARVAMDRCSRAIAEPDLFQVRVGVLKEMITHHIKEERGEIFPRARKAVKADQMKALGEEMEDRFEQALKESPAPKLDRLATSRAKEALEG